MPAHRIILVQSANPDAYYAAYDSANEQHLLTHLRRVNFKALASVASDLRNGVACTIPASEGDSHGNLSIESLKGQFGGQNCHFDIEFEDGVVWLARIRLDEPHHPPKPVQSYISLSEVATLKFLEQIDIPTPKVFHFAEESSENLVGVPFILLEKMNGDALDWQSATKSQKTRIMEQLAKITLELEKHTFGSIGSLDSPNTVGPYAQVALFESPNKPIGPFDNIVDSVKAMVKVQQNLIGTGEQSSLPVDHYLSHCWRLERSMELASLCSDSKFYLKHGEDKGDHILVDSDFNITGIIDWEFASAEPKALAFSSPCMLWPVGEFYDGSNELSLEEAEFAAIFEQLQRKDLADIVRNGRKWQRFYFFNGGGVSTDIDEFKSLFQGLRAAWTEQNADEIEPYENWKSKALKDHRHDDHLQTILVNENR